MARRRGSSINDPPGYFDALAGVAMQNYAQEIDQMTRRAPAASYDRGAYAAGVPYTNQAGDRINPSYYDRLVDQGHTVDPSTGHEIEQQYFMAPDDRKNFLKAKRDSDALMRGFQNGSLDETQLIKGVDSLQKAHGRLLVHVESFRELTGAQGAYAQKVEAMKAARAAQLGVPDEMVIWDEQRAAPKLDTEAYAVRNAERTARQEAMKPILEAQKADLEFANQQRINDLKLVEEEYRANIALDMPRADAFAVYNQKRNRVLADFQSEAAKIRGLTQAAPQAAAPQQAAPQQDLSHPKLPPTKRIKGQFNTPAEVRAAGLGPDDYFLVGSDLVRIDASGRPQKVN